MTTKMTTKTTTRERSREWYERAQQSLIEGVNSPSRGAAVYSPGPIVLERGRGTRVWDLDGNEYIDFMMSFGALIQGHAHPQIVDVVSKTMADGSHFAAATPAPGRLGPLIQVKRHLLVADDPRREQPAAARVAVHALHHRVAQVAPHRQVADLVEAVEQEERLARAQKRLQLVALQVAAQRLGQERRQ